MTAASKYWRLVRVERTGQGKTEELSPLKAFFQRQFPDLAETGELPEIEIQRQLLTLSRQSLTDEEAVSNHPASLCLRCFISNQIQQACGQLAAKFGTDHGFNRDDLLPYVLQDTFSFNRPKSGSITAANHDLESWNLDGQSPATSLGQEILQTFDPDRSSLASWTNRRVRQNRELNRFLLEHGVYLISDWAILNDTTVAQIDRIFTEFHQLPQLQIKQYQWLLKQYHNIYRQAQLQSRQAGVRGQCPSPTPQQLEQIAQQLRPQLRLSGPQVLSCLQDVAELLRQYRIYVRGGLVSQESLDDPSLSRQVSEIPAPSLSDDEQAQQEFLTFYQQQLTQCLDQAIAQVLSHRLSRLQQKHPTLVQPFLQGLDLVHCQGQAMGDIAPLIHLEAQYQVTRLLKLKQLRADVRRSMAEPLHQAVFQAAIAYSTPDNLVTLDQRIEAALNEQITGLIAASELEGSRPRGQPLKNFFARRLCEHLQTLKPLP